MEKPLFMVPGRDQMPVTLHSRGKFIIFLGGGVPPGPKNPYPISDLTLTIYTLISAALNRIFNVCDVPNYVFLSSRCNVCGRPR